MHYIRIIAKSDRLYEEIEVFNIGYDKHIYNGKESNKLLTERIISH